MLAIVISGDDPISQRPNAVPPWRSTIPVVWLWRGHVAASSSCAFVVTVSVVTMADAISRRTLGSTP
jgi:hypothetical protein